jgi:integrase/recombinase XerD
MNSRQGTRYIKTRLGNELKEKILQYNGIISNSEAKKKRPILSCPRCELINAIENKYCSKCSYPLKPEAYDEIKIPEDKKLKLLEEKHRQDIQSIRQEMNIQFTQIINMIQQNPNLKYIKPELLSQKNNRKINKYFL